MRRIATMISSVGAAEEADPPDSFRNQVFLFLGVGLVLFLASLLGILTRPLGFLAAFWPANAILLGLMVRNPQFAKLAGWLGAFVGYVAADFLTRGEVGITLWLTVANMAGAITGFLLFQLLPAGDRGLARPQSVLSLFAICCVAAAVAGLVGGGAARFLFGRNFLTGFEFWFVTELVNNLAILPAILTYPKRKASDAPKLQPGSLVPSLLNRKLIPLAALIVSVFVAMVVDGPGAIAFPVPALLWCALTYRIFSTACITMCLCVWMLIAISADVIQVAVSHEDFASTSSLRLGIALIALGPLMAASINASRIALVEQLGHLADHDALTDLLSRRAFLQRCERMVMRQHYDKKTVAVLMLDVDHFKNVNDMLGHATGDRVLITFANTIVQSLRPQDLVGRIGGEEFAVVILDTSAARAIDIAERIRAAVAADYDDGSGGVVSVTVSIGVKVSDPADPMHFEALLAAADRALYQAKNEGRNRVVVA